MNLSIENRELLLPYHFYLIGCVFGILGSVYFFESFICVALLLLFVNFKTFIRIFIVFISLLCILNIHQNIRLKTDYIPVNIPVVVNAKVKSIMTYPYRRTYIILDKVKLKYKNNIQRLKGKLLWKIYGSKYTPLPGQKIEGKFKIRPIISHKNPGSVDFSRRYRFNNIHFVMYSKGDILKKVKIKGNPTFLWKVKHRVRSKLICLTENLKNRGLIFALLIGDRSYITHKQMGLLTRASLIHLISQSGLHVGFVAMMGFVLVFFLGYIYPDIFLFIPRQKLVLIISSVYVLIFLCISEVRPSLIRASIMFFCWAILFFFNHRYAVIDGLAISLGILFILNPYSLFDIGLELSYISVISIILFYPYINKKIIVNKPTYVKYLLTILIISLIINIALYPLISYYFGIVPLSFYTNIFFVPVIGFVIFPFLFISLAVSFLSLHISRYLFDINDVCLSLCMKLLGFLDKHKLIITTVSIRPNSFMIIGYYLLGISICLFVSNKIRKKYIFTSIIGIILIFIPFIKGYFKDFKDKVVTNIFDVGHSQSILITHKGKRVLIDGGGSWNRRFDFGKSIISPILTYTRFPVLDKIILTKNDIYHMGGLFFIVKNYKINDFYYNGIEDSNGIKYIMDILKKRNIRIHVLRKGDHIFVSNNLRFDVLNPSKKWSSKNDNAISLKIVYNNIPVMFICSNSGYNSLNSMLSLDLRSNVFIAPLSKVDTNMLYDLIYRVSPYILINSYNLKKYNLIWQNLSKGNIKIYNPLICGCIEIYFKKTHKLYTKLRTYKKCRRLIYE